jgi:predicted P-loop ATPase
MLKNPTDFEIVTKSGQFDSSYLDDKGTQTTLSGDIQPLFPDVREVGEGKPPRVLNTKENFEAMLNAYGLKLATNAMNLEVELYQGARRLELSDDCVRSKLIGMASRCGLPKSAIDDHLSAAAKNIHVHPVRRWLDGGAWDETERASKVFACLNASEPDTADMVLTKWCVGAIASLYEETFNSKLVPVLQGDQSTMKTAFIERIAMVTEGAFLEGAELNPDNKDSVLSCIRSWIVELGELERTSKNCQGSIKAFITKRIDTVRPPYARFDTKKPRQTHMIATVNGVEFLRDDTGSTRYAVLSLNGPVDISGLNRLLGWKYENGSLTQEHPEELRQFWLEIKHKYESGNGWNLSSDETEQLISVNDTYRALSSHERAIVDHFIATASPNTIKRWLTPTEVCFKIGFQPTHAAQIGKALTKLTSEGVIESKPQKHSRVYLLPTPIQQP